jgi:hypothetical protein
MIVAREALSASYPSGVAGGVARAFRPRFQEIPTTI